MSYSELLGVMSKSIGINMIYFESIGMSRNYYEILRVINNY